MTKNYHDKEPPQKIPHQVKREDPKILGCIGRGAGENENGITLKLSETELALNSVAALDTRES